MATEIIPASLGEMRAFSTASGGSALSTTLITLGLPKGTRLVTLTPRNFAGAVVCRFFLNPYLYVLKTTDGLAATANLTDASDAVQDGDTSTTLDLSSQSTAAANDFLYIGAHLPFRGVNIDVGNTNGNASVLTVKYWNGSTWADITATDGTASAGATLAQDGTVTWTVPSGWTAAALAQIGDTNPSPMADHLGENNIYWTRWQFSATLDASVTIRELHALNRSTAYNEIVEGQSMELLAKRGQGGYGSLEALVDAGTGYLIALAATGAGGRFS